MTQGVVTRRAGAPSGDVPSGPDPAALAVGDPVVGIARTLAMLSRTLDESCMAAGLTLAQYRALLFVALRPWRAAALAGEMGVRRPTLSGIIDSLDRSGLVVRRAVADDRRGVSISLTPTGSAALRAVESDMRARLSRSIERSTDGTSVDPTVLAGMLRVLLCGIDRPGEPGEHGGAAESATRSRGKARATAREPATRSGARDPGYLPEGGAT